MLRIEVDRFGDERGFFMETYRRDRYLAAGIDATFVQDNLSRSRANVLRGLHLQDPSAPMAKLVRCSSGEIFDVAVDLRSDSPTLGHWVGEIISEANGIQLFIPAGFGHGFLTLSETADLQYKCSSNYAPEAEIAVAWNDAQIGIDWKVTAPVVSDRDAAGITLEQYLAAPAERRF